MNQKLETFAVVFDKYGDAYDADPSQEIQARAEAAAKDGYRLQNIISTPIVGGANSSTSTTAMFTMIFEKVENVDDVHTRLDELLAERDELLTKVEDQDSRIASLEARIEAAVL